MALFFLGVLIVFNVSSFEFHQVKLPVTSSPMMSGPQFTRPESTALSGLEEMVESYYKLQNSTQVYRNTLADLVGLAGESH